MYTMLIVEDELSFREGILAMIDWEAEGVRIIGAAANGRKALELMADEEPDILITDIRMPQMSGLELIVDLSDFVLEPNAIGFWGPGEREFLARRVKQVVRFGRSPVPITATLIEVAGRRYGFPGNLADDRSQAITLLRSLRG